MWLKFSLTKASCFRWETTTQTKLNNMKIVKTIALVLAAAGFAVSASCGSASAPEATPPVTIPTK